MEYFLQISFTVLISIVFFYNYFHEKTGVPSNWPIVGMFPALLLNLHRVHEYTTGVLRKTLLNFHFKGPWLSNMSMLVTADPMNVNHIMSKNFGNYPKGSGFKEIFDVLGDGIFNSDYELWEYNRKMAISFFGHPKFHELLVKKSEEKIRNGLIPVLDHFSKQGIEIDLEDVISRFAFDTISTIIMDFDPKSLSIDFPSVPPSKALDDLEEVILYRHALPQFMWKFQRWLSVGREKRYKEACKILDDFAYNCIEIKKSQNMSANPINNEMGVDLLTLYMEEIEKNNEITPNKKIDTQKFLRDTVINFFVAGRDSTSTALSWFFYLLLKNPRVEKKVRAEIDEIMNQAQDFSKNSRELCTKMVYLHASLCESMRLYPPVVFEIKTPLKPDTLPSGHKTDPNTQVVFHLYSMARMASIWGDDCCEFKPERWITEQGKIKLEPSYKYFVFNSGPRTCVGRDMAFTQMKVLIATMLRNYNFGAVEGFPVVPSLSVILHMKYGFKVKVSKR